MIEESLSFVIKFVCLRSFWWKMNITWTVLDFFQTQEEGWGKMLAELMIDRARNFSSGVHGPEAAVSLGLQEDGTASCLRSRKRSE